MKRNTRKRKSSTKRRKQIKNNLYKPSSGRKYFKILFIMIFVIVALYYVLPDSITITTGMKDYEKEEIKDIVREVLVEEKQKELINGEAQDNITEKQPVEQTQEETKPQQAEVTSRGGLVREATQPVEDKSLTGYRITSYYPGDGCASTGKTGSGKTTADFGTKTVAGKQVYTYQGKIVVACATQELKNTGYNVKGSQEAQVKHYFKYYDTLQINIDGTLYDAIVLDSCGAAMWKGEYRIDIFVPDGSNVINRSNVTAYFN